MLMFIHICRRSPFINPTSPMGVNYFNQHRSCNVYIKGFIASSPMQSPLEANRPSAIGSYGLLVAAVATSVSRSFRMAVLLLCLSSKCMPESTIELSKCMHFHRVPLRPFGVMINDERPDCCSFSQGKWAFHLPPFS